MAEGTEKMDWRNIDYGLEIPTEYYSDQPYVLKADDDSWVCCLTTGEAREGMPGQYIATMISVDQGKTWTGLNRMEPTGAPENSYSVLLKTHFGRIYCFYNYNKDNVRELIANEPPFKDGICKRVDSQGYYCFRYSDDNGRTWSEERGEVPIRRFQIDYKNPYKGEIMFFWNVGKPLIDGNDAYLSIHKVGELGIGTFVKSEGVLVKSSNIMTEKNIDKLKFETLPDGNIGLRAPKGGGLVSEEQSYVSLSDGSFFSVYRTIDGRAAFTYSRNKGHTWDEPAYMPVKNPRAANFVWKLDSGDFLYWFHNHGGKWYDDRNPVWCLAGSEKDSVEGRVIEWSQPEILLYHDDPNTRISYPDLIQDNGIMYITETQKDIGRTHPIDSLFIKKLLSWKTASAIIEEGLIFSSSAGKYKVSDPSPFLEFDHIGPASCTGDLRSGFSIDFWLSDIPEATTTIYDNRKDDGSGIYICTNRNNRIRFEMSDGMSVSSWESDPETLIDGDNHIAIIVDGGPKVISYIINGKFNDGGNDRQYGWGRFNPNQRHADGCGETLIDKSVKVIRIYDRVLMSVEACSNYRAGV